MVVTTTPSYGQTAHGGSSLMTPASPWRRTARCVGSEGQVHAHSVFYSACFAYRHWRHARGLHGERGHPPRWVAFDDISVTLKEDCTLSLPFYRLLPPILLP